jgi:hypothetical protein
MIADGFVAVAVVRKVGDSSNRAAAVFVGAAADHQVEDPSRGAVARADGGRPR